MTVGQTTSAVLTITNSGDTALTVNGLSITPGLESVFSTDWSSGVIAASSSQQVTIRFTPPTAQNYSGIITVVGNHTAGTNTIPVSGTGVAPVPPSSLNAVFYVWGGPSYTQYLGSFSCVFCKEFGSESINNEFGNYGSQFSTTSIRNQFSQYGSQFSSNSACNQFASNPPRVFNSNRSVYYGELTLNEFRADAIRTDVIVAWLVGDVCRH